MSAATGRRHLEMLAAAPRPPGSESEAAARRYCGEVLASLGFEVNAAPFDYSAFPGRWATPAAGVVSIVALWVAGHLGSQGEAREALVVLGATLLVGAPLALWTARRGVLALPFDRRRGVNLFATRGGASPAVWLVAHLDSKSQPVPTALRAAGIVGSAVVWMAALAIALAQWRGALVNGWWPVVAIASLVAGLPVVASVVGERSPGALDNASGVATVLVAAEVLAGVPVGVLLTSGEEHGLAGARAWGLPTRRGWRSTATASMMPARSSACVREARADRVRSPPVSKARRGAESSFVCAGSCRDFSSMPWRWPTPGGMPRRSVAETGGRLPGYTVQAMTSRILQAPGSTKRRT